MRNLLSSCLGVAGVWVFIFFFASCASDSSEYDPYHDWQVRNAEWYQQIADSARRGGNDWKMIKAYTKSPLYQSGITTDSICVHILHRGTGTIRPAFNDSVRINFRGWLMPIVNAEGKTEEVIFSQTYYSDYSFDTASPQLAAPSSFMVGFATALQHMVEGDDWMVYIPQQLFYGETATGIIPAYSTVRFRLQMAGVYPTGTVVPDWK